MSMLAKYNNKQKQNLDEIKVAFRELLDRRDLAYEQYKYLSKYELKFK